jgi:rhodanese-related sulfurtransferase
VVPEIDQQQLATAGAEGALVLDVRNGDEYAAAHVPGARLVPLPALAAQLAALPTDRPVYVICRSGGRSAQATALLRSTGVDAYSVTGGTTAWIAAGRPIDTGEADPAADGPEER